MLQLQPWVPRGIGRRMVAAPIRGWHLRPHIQVFLARGLLRVGGPLRLDEFDAVTEVEQPGSGTLAATPTELDPFGSSWLRRVCAAAQAFNIKYECRPLPHSNTTRSVLEDTDPMTHAAEALSQIYPMRRAWDPDDTIKFAIHMQVLWGHKLPEIRRAVIDEIKQLKDDMEGQIDEWLNSLAPDIREGYGEGALCGPLFFRLLRMVDFPDADQLEHDCTNGFNLVGDIPTGAGWPPNFDNGLPRPWREFQTLNDEYVRTQIRTREPGELSEVMLQEIETERGLGRMKGPFEAPRNGASLRSTRTALATPSRDSSYITPRTSIATRRWPSRSPRSERMGPKRSGEAKIGAEARRTA